jgi:hypothetical protein
VILAANFGMGELRRSWTVNLAKVSKNTEKYRIFVVDLVLAGAIVRL